MILRLRGLRALVVARLGPLAKAELRARVSAQLAPRASAYAQALAQAEAVQRALVAAEPRVQGALARLDRTPFSPDTTVHAAHARHPGVQAVFARHGLPRCPDCAVGAEETLAEAAFGESLPLDVLLAELQAVLNLPAPGGEGAG